MTTTEGLWGIGCFRRGGETVTFPVGTADVTRDLASAARALATLSIGRGARVLLISRLSEAAQYGPLQSALVTTGARLSSAEATRFDAFRTAMFLSRLRYDAVLGLDGEVLDGIGDLGRGLTEVFGAAAVIGARADAYPRLCEEGLKPRLWLHLGPAIAVECGERGGAHVDGEEWSLEMDRGEVLISARKPRRAKIERERTGLRGTVTSGRCGCGRSDPRVVPA
jgi:hypothetical protein